MPIQESSVIWKNGEFLPWHQATTHVLSHGLHYGTGVFEGIRVYDTPAGPMGFRLGDHMRRMQDSARIYHMPLPYSAEAMVQASHELIRLNGLTSAYIRPIAYFGYGSIGVVPEAETPLDVVIAAFEWGAYLGNDGQQKGVDVCVSSWNRVAPNTIPAGAKATGNYLSGYLISREAKTRGFREGIALGVDGRLSEGAGENVFLVHKGKILTPPASSSVLLGITRDSVVTLAGDLGYEVVEQPIPREMLYVADEMFLTGTAAEVTAVRSVDGIALKGGAPGPVTGRISEAFFGLFNGGTEDRQGWLEPIEAAAGKIAAADQTGATEIRNGAAVTV